MTDKKQQVIELLGACAATKHKIADKIDAIYNPPEVDPMEAYIGKLCEFTDGEWPEHPYIKQLHSIDDAGLPYCIDTDGDRGDEWNHCRPFYGIHMIPHDGRELPYYEQRCHVLWNTGNITTADTISSKSIWPLIAAFLPIDDNGDPDRAAIDARRWEG